VQIRHSKGRPPPPLDWTGLNPPEQDHAAAQRVLLLASMSVAAVLFLTAAGLLHLARAPDVAAHSVAELSVDAAPATDDTPQAPPALALNRPVAAPVPEPAPEPVEYVTRRLPMEPVSPPRLQTPEETNTFVSPAPCVRNLQAVAQEATLYFELGSYVLNVDQIATARAIGRGIADCPEAALQVWGHADGSGGDQFNAALSGNRARNTLAALSAMGFDTSRMEFVAFGATRPLAEGDADGAHDRRVEFRVIPRPK
jgi:outer membrane protein OmpA-like peptidoglycan-associated protein